MGRTSNPAAERMNLAYKKLVEYYEKGESDDTDALDEIMELLEPQEILKVPKEFEPKKKKTG